VTRHTTAMTAEAASEHGPLLPLVPLLARRGQTRSFGEVWLHVAGFRALSAAAWLQQGGAIVAGPNQRALHHEHELARSLSLSKDTHTAASARLPRSTNLYGIPDASHHVAQTPG
jgi:hypothetical protein